MCLSERNEEDVHICITLVKTCNIEEKVCSGCPHTDYGERLSNDENIMGDVHDGMRYLIHYTKQILLQLY